MNVILSAVWVLLFPLISWGQTITIDAITTGHDINANNLSVTHTGAADATLALACVSERDSATGNLGAGPSVTYNGVSMTLVPGATVIANSRAKSSLFYILSPPSGAQTVAMTRSTNANRYSMSVLTLKRTALVSTFNTAATFSSTSSANIDIDGLASASGEFAVMCGMQVSNAPIISPDATAPVSTEQVDVDHTDSTGLSHFVYTENGASTSINMRVDTDTTATTTLPTAAVAVSIRPEGTVSFGVLRRRSQ